MCGAIRFSYDPQLDAQLAELLPEEQLRRCRESGEVETRFWQPRPFLPALLDGELRLFDWGNRDPAIDLPRTGWIRAESLADGRWRHLRPREVAIPALAGYEKKVWFTILHGLRGYLVQRGEHTRLYMLTLPPTPEYQALTGHDRMPALIDQAEVTPLGPLPPLQPPLFPA